MCHVKVGVRVRLRYCATDYVKLQRDGITCMTCCCEDTLSIETQRHYYLGVDWKRVKFDVCISKVDFDAAVGKEERYGSCFLGYLFFKYFTAVEKHHREYYYQ